MRHRVCSVSVDLDPLGCYYGIHGLGAPPEPLRDVVLRRGLPRFLELFARHGLRGTFFIVGEDLHRDGRSHSPAGRELVRRAAAEGHELGNHSYGHRYDLGRLSPSVVDAELGRAHDLIVEVAGVPPVGFRAPGYNLSSQMLRAAVARGYRYDSSVLPAPLYYGAKAAVMGALRLRRQRSGSSLGDPRLLTAPRRPYRPDLRVPWRRGQASLVELPITVSPHLRVPVIGTYIVGAPDAVRVRLLESVRGESFFNFELHGIDLVGADEDGIPGELVARQPDLRVPLTDKLRRLDASLGRLALDFDFAPLGEVAATVQREGRV